MRPASRPAWLAALVVTVGVLCAPAPAAQQSFADRVAALSEPGGYFDTDNLISNERSYLHVIPTLRAPVLHGGAYLGVGPDQNFSYIAHSRPAIAILIDIRRDNLLLHLLFKALFSLARTRVEYAALLTGRAPPASLEAWRRTPVDGLAAYVDRAPRLDAAGQAAPRARLHAAIRGYGVISSAADLATIFRFHQRFIDDGLSLRFNTTGRAPQSTYPTLRDLLLETDRAGDERSYLANEDDFQFVKGLQARDLVIPVVGDLAGTAAMPAIARFLAGRQTRVSAFYASNVEFYLFRAGTFGRFVEHVERLPSADAGVLIRSIFTGALRVEPGYNSASGTQPMRDLVDGYARGRFRTYADLVTATR